MSFFDELKESLSRVWALVLTVLAAVSASIPELQAGGQVVVDTLFAVIDQLRAALEGVVGPLATAWLVLPSKLRAVVENFRFGK